MSDPVKDESVGAVRAVAGLAFVVAVAIALAVQLPGLVAAEWSLFDTRIYLDGGHAVFRDPDALYVTQWQGGWLFTYPPFAAVVFGVLDVLPAGLATGLLVVGTILAAARISLLVTRGIVERTPSAWLASRPEPVRDAIAFAAATAVLLLAVISEPVRGTIGFGQVNVILAWLVVEDFLGWGTRRSWRAGVLTGVAAGVKITPALLLIPRLLAGDWRGVRGGLLAGAATVAVSAAVTWQQTWDYYTRWLWDTTRPGDPWYAWNQSLVGTSYRIAGEDGAAALRWILVLVAVTAGVYAATMLFRRNDRVGAVLVGWLTIYLVSPITWFHHLVLVPMLLAWLIALDVRLPTRWRTVIRVTGAILAVSAIAGLCRIGPNGGGVELSYGPGQLLLVDSFPIAGLVLVIVLAGTVATTFDRPRTWASGMDGA